MSSTRNCIGRRAKEIRLFLTAFLNPNFGNRPIQGSKRPFDFQGIPQTALAASSSICTARRRLLPPGAAGNEGIKVVRSFLPAGIVFAAFAPAKLIALRGINSPEVNPATENSSVSLSMMLAWPARPSVGARSLSLERCQLRVNARGIGSAIGMVDLALTKKR